MHPFWRFVAFTAVVCILSFFATRALRSYFHQVNTVANDEEFWGDGTHNYRVSLDANLTRAGDHGPSVGEIDGDVLSPGGNLLTLQIHCPSLRYTVTDETGRTIVPMSPGPFDESAILRWLAAADLDVHDPPVRGLARRTYQSICKRLDVQPGPLPPLESRSMSGGSSGSYINLDSAPPALMPACVIAWSIVWLIGTGLIFRAAGRKSVRPTALKEPAT